MGLSEVVLDAQGEVILGPVLPELVEDRLDHARGELLAGKTVAASDDLARAPCLGQGVHHVQVQRLAGRARLLGAVEYGDGLDGGRQGGGEVLHRERAGRGAP